jgi:hypothetical protein
LPERSLELRYPEQLLQAMGECAGAEGSQAIIGRTSVACVTGGCIVALVAQPQNGNEGASRVFAQFAANLGAALTRHPLADNCTIRPGSSVTMKPRSRKPLPVDINHIGSSSISMM